VVLKKSEPIAKAFKTLASQITFDFLGNNKKLKLIPRHLIPTPPLITYRKIPELINLIYN
jgi:hypothetical protein